MKTFAIALLSAAIPGFAQQQQISVQTSQSTNTIFPVATDTQPGLFSAADHLKLTAALSPTSLVQWKQLVGVPPLQPLLSYTFIPQNPSEKNQKNGYAGLDPNGLLFVNLLPQATLTSPGCVTPGQVATWNGKQNALGFPPENSLMKTKAGGYPGLGSDGKILPNELPPFQAPLNFTPIDSAKIDKPLGIPSLDANGKLLASELPIASIQVWNEVYQVPTVPVATYTLINANVTGISVVAYKNRARQIVNTDYSVSGNVVTFSPLPNVGDVFVFDYQHQ